MNSYLLSASILLFLVALVHTVLGEILIFRRMRTVGIVPVDGGTVLKERHVRILWSTWHLVTVSSWGISLILLQLARATQVQGPHKTILMAIAVAMLVSAALVMVGTKARHPGWIGLLVAAVLTWLGLPA